MKIDSNGIITVTSGDTPRIPFRVLDPTARIGVDLTGFDIIFSVKDEKNNKLIEKTSAIATELVIANQITNPGVFEVLLREMDSFNIVGSFNYDVEITLYRNVGGVIEHGVVTPIRSIINITKDYSNAG